MSLVRLVCTLAITYAPKALYSAANKVGGVIVGENGCVLAPMKVMVIKYLVTVTLAKNTQAATVLGTVIRISVNKAFTAPTSFGVYGS